MKRTREFSSYNFGDTLKYHAKKDLVFIDGCVWLKTISEFYKDFFIKQEPPYQPADHCKSQGIE
jgi:hypothetical protein